MHKMYKFMWIRNKFHTWVQNEIIKESQNKLDIKAIKKLNVGEKLERKLLQNKAYGSMWMTMQRKTNWKWDIDDDDELDGKRV